MRLHFVSLHAAAVSGAVNPRALDTVHERGQGSAVGDVMADKLQLFDAGHVVRTFGALMAMVSSNVSEWSVLERHQSGDFGQIDAGWRKRNQDAIACTGCVLSAFPLGTGTTVWVVTERDRHMTTVLLDTEFARRFPELACGPSLV